jgi:hypothetical protein
VTSRKSFGVFLIAIFFAIATCILLGVGALEAPIIARHHLEALPGTTLVAHTLPHVAGTRVSDTRDCHGIGQHRLLSPAHVGLVARRGHFHYQRTERRRTDSLSAISLRAAVSVSLPPALSLLICRDRNYEEYLPEVP